MTREEAYRILNVPQTATIEMITSAWRRMIREAHPDTSAYGGDRVVFEQVQLAYKILKAATGTCSTCHGTGQYTVRVYHGLLHSTLIQPCPQCRSHSQPPCHVCRGSKRMTISKGLFSTSIVCPHCTS